ncbi:MAG TPA: lipopolysaccharide kinase InaA family protein [Candidatus Binataceae bacterium]|nr:lipopolysaccharide kinase InaA family protein [Candidatus Binataceae bacterium]
MNVSRRKRAGRRWVLTVGIDEESPLELRDQLIERAVGAADGSASELIRRSRHASTYKIYAQAGGERLEAFAKVIDPPSGFERITRLFRGDYGARLAHITREFVGAGLEAPAVLLYGRDRATGRELIVTHRAEGQGPLRTLVLVRGSLRHKREILRGLGRAIARLHRAGFVHGDLTPFNILFTRSESPRFTFIDNERTRRNVMFGLKRQQLRNLIQLGRFDLPGLTRADRVRVYRAYEVAMTGHNRRRSVRRAAAMLNRRLARDRLAAQSR